MKYNLSKRIIQLPKFKIGELLKIAEERKDIISLGPGEPDFYSPDFVREAAKKSLDKKETHYSPVSGRSDLKREIVKKLKRENKITYNSNDISVTCGSNEALVLALLALIDPGEEVLVPDPSFLAYRPMVQMLNGYPVSVPLTQENEFNLTKESLQNAIKDPKKVKALILNTPGNPTGTVMNKKALEELADVVVENNIIVISDEAYEYLTYERRKHISFASLNGMKDYTLTLQTFSKTLAMAGFRIGYAAGPSQIIKAMNKLHIFTTLSAPTTSQTAVRDALKNWKQAKKEIKRMRDSYNKRRKLIYKRTNEISGFYAHEPFGAFYLFPKFDFKMKSLDFSEWLLKNAKVAAVPGSEFGVYGEGFLRFSYATEYSKIEQAMDQIEAAVRKLK